MEALETTGTQLAQLDRLERIFESWQDVHTDVQKLRAEIATCRAAVDELTEVLERLADLPPLTLQSQVRGIVGDMTAPR